MKKVFVAMTVLLALSGCETQTYKETSHNVSDALSTAGEAVKEGAKATSEAISEACEDVKESAGAENTGC